MPLLDYDNEFTALGGQGPITATAFTTPGKALDGIGVLDWGRGRPSKIYARVTQGFNNLTSLDIEVGGADDNAGTNFVSYVKSNFLLAALGLNALLAVGFIRAGLTRKRFLLGKFTVNGAAPSTGKITMGLIDPDAGSQDGFSNF